MKEKKLKTVQIELSGKEHLFSSLMMKEIKKVSSGSKINSAEALAHMDYIDEIRIKESALKEYWLLNKLPGQPNSIITSPKGRYYRTTSKRKVIIADGKSYFVLGPRSAAGDKLFERSLLEPPEHSVIYEFLNEKVNESAFRLIGKSLNYIIIRGNYTEFTVIFNVHTLTADIVRKLKLLTEHLKTLEINIVSAFVYLDPTRSDYYFENERPVDTLDFKKLFGPDRIFLKFDDRKYSYHPTSFSQINESIIPVLLKEARKLLQPKKEFRFYDLYSGYGLFTLYLVNEFGHCTGIDVEGESINSAIVNASFHPAKQRIRFFPRNITGETLEQLLPPSSGNEIFLLDPPRQGTEREVIRSIAERHPLRVLHIFCGIEEIKRETTEWAKNGYKVKEVQPLDMFPGTLNLEILILLEPSQE